MNKEGKNTVVWNMDWEICAGKKREFPKTPITFHRHSKSQEKYEEELQKAIKGNCTLFNKATI